MNPDDKMKTDLHEAFYSEASARLTAKLLKSDAQIDDLAIDPAKRFYTQEQVLEYLRTNNHKDWNFNRSVWDFHEDNDVDEKIALGALFELTPPAPSAPPAFAEFLFSLITKPNLRDAAIGDMEEKFHDHVEQFGHARAVRFYWSQVIRSLVPLIWSGLKRLLTIAAIWRYFSK